MTATDAPATDSLERLHDALLRNAEWFRKAGHEPCAWESEIFAARLRAAMDAMEVAS